jgi:hypothetical protein
LQDLAKVATTNQNDNFSVYNVKKFKREVFDEDYIDILL